MRTTITLDEDCYERLQREMRRRGCSFRALVNESLRRGLDEMTRPSRRQPVRIQTFSSTWAPGVDLDCIARTLEQLDGPGWR